MPKFAAVARSTWPNTPQWPVVHFRIRSSGPKRGRTLKSNIGEFGTIFETSLDHESADQLGLLLKSLGQKISRHCPSNKNDSYKRKFHKGIPNVLSKVRHRGVENYFHDNYGSGTGIGSNIFSDPDPFFAEVNNSGSERIPIRLHSTVMNSLNTVQV